MKLNRLLTKLHKIAAWLLFPMIILFFITGWSMTGRVPIMDRGVAHWIHTTLWVLVLIFFVVHAGIQIYFWFKKRKK